MRIYLAGIILIGTLSAGCSSDWDPSRDARAKASAEQQATPLPTATLAAREGTTSFASLPDRGELLSYAKDREVRRSGAYTSYPVEISEAHALNAIAAGGLRLVTPDGKPVNIAFDRIEEHPDGNWTWVGQSGTGDHAVLTFGESAVFGEFSSGGRSYRVTTRRGAAFVVETDPMLLAGHPGHHGDGPEFLIPPSMADAGGGAAGSKAMAAAAASAETKAASAVIDLALGYTQGMVATYGNQATAVTRLTNLVALGNNAYQRSGVNMRLRLVHTLQVNFPDNTDNADALQKLTGYNSSTSQFVNADPAFSALRSARDQYGADLVALVRQHRSPEQKGCGIAWLIGANQRAITAADAPFGYSVVSDGSDLDEGDNNTYFCSDYSLVHELGHSMGQAHNQEDSQYVGAHSYSYGYRETSPTGFHTIMAYPLANSSQTEAPYFATPTINFAAGRPYGTATTDNVRSMNQTMPIVSTFRATVVPVAARLQQDINADGKDDLVWFNANQSLYGYWLLDGAAITHAPNVVATRSYTIAAQGDFTGDGRSDLIWVGPQRDIWLVASAGSGYAGGVYLGNYPAGWQIIAAGDVNGDGTSDLIWHNPGALQYGYWLMRAGGVLSMHSAPAAPGVTLVTSGDFNGDGFLDLIWTNSAGDLVLLSGTGSGFTDSMIGRYPDAGRIFAARDVNGDGKDDLLILNRATNMWGYWLMDGNRVVGSAGFPAAPGYYPVSVGDFNGDGRADVIWSSGASDLQLLAGSSSGAFVHVTLGAFSGGWRPVDTSVRVAN